MKPLHILLILLHCGFSLESQSLNITFSVNSYITGTCPGGTSAGLGSTDIRLEYRNDTSGLQWVEIANIPIGGDFSSVVNIPGSGCVVLRLVQDEHGGGDCNCWEVTNMEIAGIVPSTPTEVIK